MILTHLIEDELTQIDQVKLFRGHKGGSIETRTYPIASLDDRNYLKDILISIKYGFKLIWIPQNISLPILQEIIQEPYCHGLTIILNNLSRLRGTSEPLEIERWVKFAHLKDIEIYLLEQQKIPN